MGYAFYLTNGEMLAAILFAVLVFSLVMLSVSGIYKGYRLERSAENVRHRPAKQNSDL